MELVVWNRVKYYFKHNCDKKSKLLFPDNDSGTYEIKIENVWKYFTSDKEMFDFSSYSTNSKYFNNSNKLVIGKMKD